MVAACEPVKRVKVFGHRKKDQDSMWQYVGQYEQRSRFLRGIIFNSKATESTSHMKIDNNISNK